MRSRCYARLDYAAFCLCPQRRLVTPHQNVDHVTERPAPLRLETSDAVGLQIYPPQFWYTADPSLALERIRRNAAIRQSLASARTDIEAEDWLSRKVIGRQHVAGRRCRPLCRRPRPHLDTGEVLTLVFGGRRRLRKSAIPTRGVTCNRHDSDRPRGDQVPMPLLLEVMAATGSPLTGD
jgi:hypothetical protein